jgi:two-component system phosphate regulon response regulator PhoB
MLPGLSGIELIKRLRARPETSALPVIMLTARSDETERLRGLRTGADDYIVKPFSVSELRARIRVLLRRTARPASNSLRAAPHILIAEDDKPLADVLRIQFEAEGYVVESFGRGDEAYRQLQENPPDLAIIDWMLPGLSGIDLIKRLRMQPETEALPVIMLTARSGENDVVRALVTGADDYVVKPFHKPELLARVRALLRRTIKPAVGVLTAGDIVLDVARQQVTRGKRDIPLGPIEFQLLKLLMENSGRVLARKHLLDNVWGQDAYLDERAVDNQVRKLRKRLNHENATDPIRTVRGIGYAFEPAEAKLPPEVPAQEPAALDPFW